MLEELVTALAARGRMAPPPAWQRGYELLAEDPDQAVGRLARLAAVRFGDPRGMPELRSLVADSAADANDRRQALAALVSAKDAGLPPVLHRLVADPAIGPDAINGLAAVPHRSTPDVLVAAYDGLPPAGRQAAIVADAKGLIVVLDVASGERVWDFDAGGGFSAGAAVAAGRLVIASDDGTIWCFKSAE
jgi:hypothetical protein